MPADGRYSSLGKCIGTIRIGSFIRVTFLFALRVTFFSGDEGKHELRFNFVDADGHSIMPGFPPIPVEVVLPDDMHFGTTAPRSTF